MRWQGSHWNRRPARKRHWEHLLNVMLHRSSVEFLPGRLENVRPLLHIPGLLENALVAVALQAAEYVMVLIGQKSIKAVEMFEGLHAADWPSLCLKQST